MIKVENLSKKFGAIQALRDISFSMEKGEILGIVGPSGAGKSVLLKLVAGIYGASSGSISLAGEPVSSTLGGSQSIGFLFQEGALFDSMTVLENVIFPLRNCPSSSEGERSFSEMTDLAYEILCSVGLSAAYAKYPGQLSGGMRKRAALARALVHRPEVVCLDCPTSGLDPVAASVIMELIAELHESYSPTVLIVSHDIRRLMPNVHRMLGLFAGESSGVMLPEEAELSKSPRLFKFLSTRFDFSTS